VSQIRYQTDDEKLELYGMLKDYLAPVLPDRYALSSIGSQALRDTLGRLQGVQGLPVSLLPELMFVEITGVPGNEYVTIVHNRAHWNITSIFGEEKNLKPDEDTLTVVPGFLGSYPNVFFRLNEDEIESFVSSLSMLGSEDDYSQLLDQYGVRRTNPDFWQQGDAFHAAYRLNAPVEYGLFDYNRLDNR
jgi:hypothetical protein